MSRTLFPRLLAAMLLAGMLVAGRVALADAASLEELIAGALTPSAAPALLGPITSAGRKGWDCRPEHAAASQEWQTADLPSSPASP